MCAIAQGAAIAVFENRGSWGSPTLSVRALRPAMASPPRAAAAAACLLLLLAGGSGAAVAPPWPFSWATVSTFAFPGASPRFMNATELARFARFSMNNIWGVNATCINTTDGSSTFPATCPGDSWCSCLPDAPHNDGYEAQRWVLSMDSSLQAQSAAIKAAAGAPAARAMPVLGYFNLDVAQQYSAHQFAFCYDNATFGALRLATQAKGVIDCFRDGCDYQGMEYCMYDFRLPAARDFWVETVLPALIDSPDIDGVFLDESDNLVNNLCHQWACTPQELADLTNGTLQLLDAALAKAAALGKWLSISLTSTLSLNAAYLQAVLASILKHGSGFRYYEFFKSEEDLEAFIYEAQTLGIPVQAHAESMTMNPDFGEFWSVWAGGLSGAQPRAEGRPSTPTALCSLCGPRPLLTRRLPSRARARAPILRSSRARRLPARRRALLVLLLQPSLELWRLPVAPAVRRAAWRAAWPARAHKQDHAAAGVGGNERDERRMWAYPGARAQRRALCLPGQPGLRGRVRRGRARQRFLRDLDVGRKRWRRLALWLLRAPGRAARRLPCARRRRRLRRAVLHRHGARHRLGRRLCR